MNQKDCELFFCIFWPLLNILIIANHSPDFKDLVCDILEYTYKGILRSDILKSKKYQ